MATKIGNTEIIFSQSHPDFENTWLPFGRETKVLSKGWLKDEGRKPMSVNVIWDKDVPIVLRDGVTIYGDIFRPEKSNTEPVAALLPWSPFGKTGTGISFFLTPMRLNVLARRTLKENLMLIVLD